jgi:aldehyde:ferredoxin oxidoreductase
MNNFQFRILEVNLSIGESSKKIIQTELLKNFVGGASLASHILYPYITEALDPLSPEAPLLLITGPLTGTTGPAVGRFVICAKSPATHLWGESNIGGFFGPELRKAGYDGLMITGSASSPVYIWIKNGDVELRPADHLWGKTDTYETQDRIKEEIREPTASICCIGKAGEEQIPFASILCDHGRIAGRTGMGAVMGSKHVKAIVVHGNQDIPIIRETQFNQLRRKTNIALRDENVARAFRNYGTASGVDYMDYLGEMPKYAFTKGVLEDVWKLSGMTMAETILTGVSTCHGCVIASGRVVCLEDGVERKGPEYETIVGFGPNLGITDLPFTTLMGDWCDRYGMDTISMSNIIGLAFLLYQEGIINEEDTGGFKLEWGDKKVVEELIHMTVEKKGFGAMMEKGAKVLAEHFGAPDLAAQVNGLETPYHDPRGGSGTALVYATSPRGACHMQSDYFWVDILGRADEEIGIKPYKRHDGAEKSANVALHQNWGSIFNSLILCMHANVPVSDIIELVNCATGLEYTLDGLLEVGERSWNMKRMINHKCGLTRKNDTLPQILMKPYPDGGSEGYVIPLEEMLKAYYEARGWDEETGKPTPEKLRALGLAEYIKDIWS